MWIMSLCNVKFVLLSIQWLTTFRFLPKPKRVAVLAEGDFPFLRQYSHSGQALSACACTLVAASWSGGSYLAQIPGRGWTNLNPCQGFSSCDRKNMDPSLSWWWPLHISLVPCSWPCSLVWSAVGRCRRESSKTWMRWMWVRDEAPVSWFTRTDLAVTKVAARSWELNLVCLMGWQESYHTSSHLFLPWVDSHRKLKF